jgi:glucose-6-phosphate isomerase
MSVIRPRPPEEPLEYRLAARSPGPVLSPELAAALAAVRAALVAEPAGIEPAARLLADYDTQRPTSELFAILGQARRIRDAVDRLVVVAGGGIGPASRLLVATCCHPWHAELLRGDRGGRPRLSWLDPAASNDELQGLLDLLTAPPPPHDDLLDRWALLVADGAAAAAPQPVVAILLERLEAAVGGDRDAMAGRVVRLRGGVSFAAPEKGVDVFSAAGLLAASIAGLDVVRLLKGAAAMLQRFAEAPPDANPPLLDAAVARRAAAAGRSGRLFAGQGGWLRELSAWHDCSRDAHPGTAAAVTWVTTGEPRRDPLPGLGVTEAAAPDTADVQIGLPRLDEHAIGQLLQLLILSAAVERRLPEGV